MSLGLKTVQLSNCSIPTSTRIFNLNSELELGLESSGGTSDWTHIYEFCRLQAMYAINY